MPLSEITTLTGCENRASPRWPAAAPASARPASVATFIVSDGRSHGPSGASGAASTASAPASGTIGVLNAQPATITSTPHRNIASSVAGLDAVALHLVIGGLAGHGRRLVPARIGPEVVAHHHQRAQASQVDRAV